MKRALKILTKTFVCLKVFMRHCPPSFSCLNKESQRPTMNQIFVQKLFLKMRMVCYRENLRIRKFSFLTWIALLTYISSRFCLTTEQLFKFQLISLCLDFTKASQKSSGISNALLRNLFKQSIKFIGTFLIFQMTTSDSVAKLSTIT